MKPSFHSIRNSILLISALVLPTTSATAKPDAKPEEWIFEQFAEKTGRQKVYVSASAVRIVNEQRGFDILAKAPEWSVEIRRPDNKTVFRMPLSDFSQFSVFGPMGKRTFKQYPYEKVSTKKSEGISLTRFIIAEQNTTMWTAEEVPVSPQATSILAIYYTTMMLQGMPILLSPSKGAPPDTERIIGVDRKHMRLNTLSWAKHPLVPTDFQPCHGFKPVTSMVQILISEDKRQEINDEFGKPSSK